MEALERTPRGQRGTLRRRGSKELSNIGGGTGKRRYNEVDEKKGASLTLAMGGVRNSETAEEWNFNQTWTPNGNSKKRRGRLKWEGVLYWGWSQPLITTDRVEGLN